MVLIFSVIFVILIASACMMCRFMDDKEKGKSGRRQQRGHKDERKHYGEYGESEKDVDYRIAGGFSRDTSDRESSDDFSKK